MNGLCTGHDNPDLWFSDSTDNYGSGRTAIAQSTIMINNSLQALAICANCPVIEECKAEGMKPEHIDNGIWGGTLAGERIIATNSKNKSSPRLRQIKFAQKVRSYQTI